MTGMVERVARAMCEADGFKWDAAHFNETGNGDEPEDIKNASHKEQFQR